MQNNDNGTALVLTETELFNRAAKFGRRDVFDFRIPGTNSTHKVECVVMEQSDVAMFVASLGLGQRPADPAPVQQLARRIEDQLQASAALQFEPEPDQLPEDCAARDAVRFGMGAYVLKPDGSRSHIPAESMHIATGPTFDDDAPLETSEDDARPYYQMGAPA